MICRQSTPNSVYTRFKRKPIPWAAGAAPPRVLATRRQAERLEYRQKYPTVHRLGCERSEKRSLQLLGRHAAAALGTTTASVDAALHVADPLAIFGALGADFGACPADMLVVFRTHQHEMRRGPADLLAGQHQLEVRGLGVLPSEF